MAQDLSVNALRTYVRDFLEVDTSDIDDSLIDTWSYAAWDDLIGQANNWPFYEVGENADGSTGSTNPGVEFSITTQVGVQNYALPTLTVQGVQASVDPHNIVAVQGPHWELMYDSVTALESSFTPAFIISQEPERYSMWGTTGITLWPIPDAAYQINIRAYRSPIDWIGIGPSGLVDAPNDFWTAIAHYDLSMGWANQTDLQSASFWDTQYQQAKARLLRKYIKAPLPENIVLNGGAVTRDLPPRLRYPWEGSSTVGLGR